MMNARRKMARRRSRSTNCRLLRLAMLVALWEAGSYSAMGWTGPVTTNHLVKGLSTFTTASSSGGDIGSSSQQQRQLPTHHSTTTLLHMAKKQVPSDAGARSAKTKSTTTTTTTQYSSQWRSSNKKNKQPQAKDAASTSSSQQSQNATQAHQHHNGRVEQLIREIHEKDRKGENLTQSYCDSILGSCVAFDEWESVLEVLDIMKRHGYTQERSTYRACLQACLEAGNGASAREILQAMDKALVQPEPWDIGLTVAAMCRQDTWDHKEAASTNSSSSWWRKALALLKASAANPEIVTDSSNVIPAQAYDVILECMVEEKQWKEAVRLLRLMEDSALKQQRPEGGYHPAPGVSTYREVIECCVATNQAEQAAQVLSSMKDHGVKPSTYACELVISALSKKLQWRRALQLLDLMDEMEVPKTVVTYNSVISACARAREVGMAKSLLAKMQRSGIRPDEVSYNSVIGACASTARWKDALDLLDQCYRDPSVTPNIYIYTNAMRACAKGGNTKRALSLLQVVKDKGLPLDTYCYTAVIDACAKAKMWQKALALLEEMQDQGIEPSEVTYSVTISACGNGGQWQKALNLLKLMKSKGMSVNVITYNAALTALSKASRQRARHISKVTLDDIPARRPGQGRGGQEDEVEDHGDGLWSRSLGILEEMKADGIAPDGFCYSSAISCCGAEGRWKEALDLIDTMKKGGPRTRPNRIAYTAAISACGRAGKAENALELFQAMKDEGLSADRVAYNALFSALRVAGDAEKSFRLWGEICGTRPTASLTAIATAKDIASPDIITVTDCIATLSRAERLAELDQVFEQAVSRGIVLRSNMLDLQFETDLSGMSLPVARAAVRYILKQCTLEKDTEKLQDLSFITGVGRAQQRRIEDGATPSGDTHTDLKDPTTSLRGYVQEVLERDFDPPVMSVIPPRAQGTVEIPRSSLIEWVQQQQ